MRRMLFCRCCARAISRAVVIEPVAGPEWVSWTEEGAPGPPGHAVRSQEPYCPSLRIEDVDLSDPLQANAQVWMNLDDVLPEIGMSPDLQRCLGCCGPCGPCGSWGPNRVCVCGAHVGTEVSDCTTMKMFVPDEAATFWREVGEM
jgi:hypothetical protein